MWPISEFDHLDEHFDPKVQVRADHPMVTARPDLFTPDKPKTSKPAQG